MQELKSYASVRHWVEQVDQYYGLSEEEWRGRLAVLGQYCETLGQTPDEVIAAALDDRQSKIGYMRRLNQFARERFPDDPRAAHDMGNIVRSFFLHNGARVVTRPYQG